MSPHVDKSTAAASVSVRVDVPLDQIVSSEVTVTTRSATPHSPVATRGYANGLACPGSLTLPPQLSSHHMLYVVPLL